MEKKDLNISYKQASERLSEIINIIELESPEVDELIQLTDEAIQLITYCKKKLTETDKSIEQMLKKLDDNASEDEVIPSSTQL